MKKLFLLSAILIGAASASYAGVSFHINIGGAPVLAAPPVPVVYQPAQPAVCEPPVAAVTPPPVCEPQVTVAPPPVYQPAPQVVVTPPPVYVEPQVVYRPGVRIDVRHDEHRDGRYSRQYAYNDHRERHDEHGRDRR